VKNGPHEQHEVESLHQSAMQNIELVNHSEGDSITIRDRLENIYHIEEAQDQMSRMLFSIHSQEEEK
jgi:hypothetical protein